VLRHMVVLTDVVCVAAPSKGKNKRMCMAANKQGVGAKATASVLARGTFPITPQQAENWGWMLRVDTMSMQALVDRAVANCGQHGQKGHAQGGHVQGEQERRQAGGGRKRASPHDRGVRDTGPEKRTRVGDDEEESGGEESGTDGEAVVRFLPRGASEHTGGGDEDGEEAGESESDQDEEEESDQDEQSESSDQDEGDGQESEGDADEDGDERCEVCGSTDHVGGTKTRAHRLTMLLCDGDGCGAGWHAGCLEPALGAVPEGEWFCPVCEERKEGTRICTCARILTHTHTQHTHTRTHTGAEVSAEGWNEGDGDSEGAGWNARAHTHNTHNTHNAHTHMRARNKHTRRLRYTMPRLQINGFRGQHEQERCIR
jgi:hypothetical protein